MLEVLPLESPALKDLCRADYFFNMYRILNDWNDLPDYVVNADSVKSFESLLNSQLILDLLLYSYY